MNRKQLTLADALAFMVRDFPPASPPAPVLLLTADQCRWIPRHARPAMAERTERKAA